MSNFKLYSRKKRRSLNILQNFIQSYGKQGEIRDHTILESYIGRMDRSFVAVRIEENRFEAISNTNRRLIFLRIGSLLNPPTQTPNFYC